MKYNLNKTDKIILKEGKGRTYNCVTMTAVFKADKKETNEMYSILEWWLKPNLEGVGEHFHEDNDEIFYVLEGTTSILIGDKWIDAEKGTFIRIPAKTIHDFCNSTDKVTSLLNFFIPGGFERNIPSIAKWFEDNK